MRAVVLLYAFFSPLVAALCGYWGGWRDGKKAAPRRVVTVETPVVTMTPEQMTALAASIEAALAAGMGR